MAPGPVFLVPCFRFREARIAAENAYSHSGMLFPPFKTYGRTWLSQDTPYVPQVAWHKLIQIHTIGNAWRELSHVSGGGFVSKMSSTHTGPFVASSSEVNQQHFKQSSLQKAMWDPEIPQIFELLLL